MNDLWLRASCASGVPECDDTHSSNGLDDVFTLLAIAVVIVMVIVFSVRNRRER